MDPTKSGNTTTSSSTAQSRRYPPLLPRTQSPDGADLNRALALVVQQATQNLPSGTRSIELRRRTTSSERGRAFRARRRQLKTELQNRIDALKHEIERLLEQKSLLEARCLRHQGSDTGSRVRTIREYYTIFQRGLELPHSSLPPREDLNARIRYQEGFLHSVMVENVITGDLIGPEASLNQWRFFTAINASLRVEIKSTEVKDDKQGPWVVIHVDFHFVSGLPMVAAAYPGAEKFPHIIDTFTNRHLIIPVTTRFQFNAEGLIVYEFVDAGIVDGMLQSGVPMKVILQILPYSILSPSNTVAAAVAISE